MQHPQLIYISLTDSPVPWLFFRLETHIVTKSLSQFPLFLPGKCIKIHRLDHFVLSMFETVCTCRGSLRTVIDRALKGGVAI